MSLTRAVTWRSEGGAGAGPLFVGGGEWWVPPSACSEFLERMEALLRRELGTSVLRPTGHSGGGCISHGESFHTDQGRIYVKINSRAEVGGGGGGGGWEGRLDGGGG